MKSSNPKLIAVDLSSIVKIDESIVTLPSISISPFGASQVDLEAQETVRYAITAGKCVPLFIGQIAPVYMNDACQWLKHFAGGKYKTLLASFVHTDLTELKHCAIEKFDRIYYAFDRVEQDYPIWEENETEILS